MNVMNNVMFYINSG